MATDGLIYITFDTEMGWVGIMSSTMGLVCATLPQRSAQDAYRLLGDDVCHAHRSSRPFEDLIRRFRSYFKGSRVIFPDRLDLSGATPFQRDVWETARRIPYGETKTYAWVAEQIGRPAAARAVGQALARNPLAIIVPCHRVLASDGKLCGFGGGLDMKQRLLDLEASAQAR